MPHEDEHSPPSKPALQDRYEEVYRDAETIVYAHTTYHEVEAIDYDSITTEDEAAVDNLFSEREQRLLINPLYENQWTDRNFLASANVGIFYAIDAPPIVPDMFLSFDVTVPEGWYKKKEDRAYFLWKFGKAPELVVEVISNKKGREADEKKAIYARIGVSYYVLIDPYYELSDTYIRVFRLKGGHYEPFSAEHNYMPEIRLGIRMWEGIFERHEAPWARWCSKEGEVLKTGAENTEALSKELEREKAEKEAANQRAEKLLAQLRKLGLEPEE